MLDLPKPLEMKINELAVESGQPVETFLDQLLGDYMEDQQCAKLAESEYNQFISSGEAAVSLEKLRQDNGL